MFSRTIVTAIFVAGSLQAAPRQVLHNHVPQAVRESRRVGSLAQTARMDLAIGLPLRNAEELDRFIEQVSDPKSPIYRHYLSSEEFTEKFGPNQKDYDKLTAFLQANGLTVSGTHPNRMILDVSGPVSAIEKTLHVNMSLYVHARRGQYIAPDRDPWLDVDVEVLNITGLDTFVLPKPMNLKATPMTSAAPFVSGSGPGGLFVGNDFRAAYAPGVALTGAGQSIGLFEVDGFFPSDVTANFKQAGLPPVPVQTVLLDGVNGVPGDNNLEVIVDIMMAAYMAPGAQIIVYEGLNWNDILNRMATDNTARQLSCSWLFSINAATSANFQADDRAGAIVFAGLWRWRRLPQRDPGARGQSERNRSRRNSVVHNRSGRGMAIGERVEWKRRRRQHNVPDPQLSTEYEYGGLGRVRYDAQHP